MQSADRVLWTFIDSEGDVYVWIVILHVGSNRDIRESGILVKRLDRIDRFAYQRLTEVTVRENVKKIEQKMSLLHGRSGFEAVVVEVAVAVEIDAFNFVPL